MKTFKYIDYILQIILIATAVIGNVVITAVSNRSFLDSEFFFVGYFGVGGWQVLSVIVHFAMPKEHSIRLRKIYLWLLLITIIAFVLSLAGWVIWFLVILLFWAPVLAILYLVTCIKETRRLRQIAA